MKCPYCNGKGEYTQEDSYGEFIVVCGNCNGTGNTPKMTNEEYIQSLTTEEKAEWLAKTFNTHPCGYLLECNHCNLTSRCSEDAYPTSAEAWAEWLKEIHEKKC